jgi:hypothetical protein
MEPPVIDAAALAAFRLAQAHLLVYSFQRFVKRLLFSNNKQRLTKTSHREAQWNQSVVLPPWLFFAHRGMR